MKSAALIYSRGAIKSWDPVGKNETCIPTISKPEQGAVPDLPHNLSDDDKDDGWLKRVLRLAWEIIWPYEVVENAKLILPKYQTSPPKSQSRSKRARRTAHMS
jgi:hypothetical protein